VGLNGLSISVKSRENVKVKDTNFFNLSVGSSSIPSKNKGAAEMLFA